MTVFHLDSSCRFPDPDQAEPDGLLAVGGDLSPQRLLNAYSAGIFPWFNDEAPLLWWSPPTRAIFLPGEGSVPRRAARVIRRAAFEVKVDTCFAAVMARCAAVPRPGQEGTWISPGMQKAYLHLHQLGFAHSFETFQNGRLVGGLYGVSLGAAFFGESMFSEVEQASRSAFQALCNQLWAWGFHFIDGQLPNANLERLGARLVPREAYLQLLKAALRVETRKGFWSGGGVEGRA